MQIPKYQLVTFENTNEALVVMFTPAVLTERHRFVRYDRRVPG